MSGWSQHKSHSTIAHGIKIPNSSIQNSISATVKFESAENQLELDSEDSADCRIHKVPVKSTPNSPRRRKGKWQNIKASSLNGLQWIDRLLMRPPEVTVKCNWDQRQTNKFFADWWFIFWRGTCWLSFLDYAGQNKSLPCLILIRKIAKLQKTEIKL